MKKFLTPPLLLLLVIGYWLLVISSPSNIYATQIGNPAIPGPLGNPSKTGADEASNLFAVLLGSAFIIGVISFMGYFIWGAIQWIISEGEKSALATAKATVNHALIGLLVLFSVFIIVIIIEKIFCVNLLNISLPGTNTTVTSPCTSTGGGGGGGGGPGGFLLY